MIYDVAIIGAGLSGMTTAALLAKKGLKVIVLEAHTEIGGCAGFFKRADFRFDVGATTFISFQEKGIGHRVINYLDIQNFPVERIKEYQLCLPDRTIRIPDNWNDWISIWTEGFPEIGPKGQEFFISLSKNAQTYWEIAGRFPSLPIQNFKDIARTIHSLSVPTWTDLKCFFLSLEQFIHQHHISITPALAGAINMLLQDTTQASLNEVPCPYGLLGLTLMPHGLFRPKGSASSIWVSFENALNQYGGELRKKHEVSHVEIKKHIFELSIKHRTQKIMCNQLVSAIPVWNTLKIAPSLFNNDFEPYLERKENVDSAFALYLGIKDFCDFGNCEHYQFLRSFSFKLNDGNNFLISISPRNDIGYAPLGYRSVSISTHTNPKEWKSMTEEEQLLKGKQMVDKFLEAAEEKFPGFRQNIVMPHFYPASPVTFERFTRRYMGMAGNQPLKNSNSLLQSIPSRFGHPKFLQIGETTFPGAGTVACLLNGVNACREITGSFVETI